MLILANLTAPLNWINFHLRLTGMSSDSCIFFTEKTNPLISHKLNVLFPTMGCHSVRRSVLSKILNNKKISCTVVSFINN